MISCSSKMNAYRSVFAVPLFRHNKLEPSNNRFNWHDIRHIMGHGGKKDPSRILQSDCFSVLSMATLLFVLFVWISNNINTIMLIVLLPIYLTIYPFMYHIYINIIWITYTHIHLCNTIFPYKNMTNVIDWTLNQRYYCFKCCIYLTTLLLLYI